MDKRYWLVLALCSAMAAMAQRDSRSMPAAPIDVEVVDGRITVSAPSVRTANGEMALSWRLLTPGYRFTTDSIHFLDAADYFSCSTVNYGQVIRCVKNAGAPSGRMAYSVSLTSGGSGAVQESDPNVWIQND